MARMNATRLRLDVEWSLGDLLDGVSCEAVLANLPYVPAAAVLPPDVGAYEPRQALFAGQDGLDLVRRLVAQAGARPEVALLALEVGEGQATTVDGLVADARFNEIERLKDLAGHDRVVVGRR